MKKKNNKLFKNKNIIIIIAIISISLILLYGYFNYNQRDFRNIKIDKNESLVYTKETKKSGSYTQEIPYINIKGNNIRIINDDIIDYLNNFKNNNTSIQYEYSISGIILSLVLKVEDHNIEVATTSYFRSYNINTETLEILSNDSILQELNLNEENISNSIENKLKYYYKDLVKKEYFDSRECDYNCFLNNREINSYLDNCTYYVRNGKLIVFKPYIFASFYEEEDYFDSEDYEFEINN